MSLLDIIRARIAAEGPITVAEYMALCLGHPEHGYYMRRDPLGARGDFVTAPEVSQAFGELIGVWCAAVYQSMGSPSTLALIELGPGRGTLMADLLRAAKAAPGFREAARVHLVETSPPLRKLQSKVLNGAAEWYDAFDDVPDGPALIVANEFFDALPVHQLDGEGRERRVGAGEDGALAFVGEAIAETSPERVTVARAIAERLVRHGGAALIIDYGHLTPGLGDTLQAVRAHGFAHPLDRPGEADLTAHVDFAALAQAARVVGAVVPGAMTQGAFLEAMGIRLRAEKLGGGADILEAVDRLIAPDRMGKLFKAMTIVSPATAVPYPFGSETS